MHFRHRLLAFDHGAAEENVRFDASALISAVRAGDLAGAREILQQSPQTALARDEGGATALHYAAESGNRALVQVLLDAGADINARDGRFDATPTGWAIEYLRQRGGLLAIEIEDTIRAIEKGDAGLVQRYLSRFPALRDAVDRDGSALRARARDSRNLEISRLFGV